MKKLVVTVLAVGALAVGGAASAQDLGAVLGSILGLGSPTYTYPNAPAVVAGSVPYGTQVYTDQYGRQFYYDQYGRQVVVQQQPNPNPIPGYDAWGRPIYGSGTYSYGYGQYRPYGDADGDGVANQYDRRPYDPRYR